MAATLASVLFAVVGIILANAGRDAPKPSAIPRAAAVARQASFRLLVPNLLAMLVASLLFALIQGEQGDQRAAMMAVPAAGLFGISAVGTFVAIAWALRGYLADVSVEVARSAVFACAAAWVVAGTQTVLAAVNAGSHLHRQVSDKWWVNGLGALAFSLIVILVLIHRHVANDTIPRQVNRAARCSLGGVIPALTLYNVAALRPAQEWASSPGPGFHVVLIGTGLYILAMGIVLLRALPSSRREAWTDSSGDDQEIGITANKALTEQREPICPRAWVAMALGFAAATWLHWRRAPWDRRR